VDEESSFLLPLSRARTTYSVLMLHVLCHSTDLLTSNFIKHITYIFHIKIVTAVLSVRMHTVSNCMAYVPYVYLFRMFFVFFCLRNKMLVFLRTEVASSVLRTEVTEYRNNQQRNWMYRSVSAPKLPRTEVASYQWIFRLLGWLFECIDKACHSICILGLGFVLW